MKFLLKCVLWKRKLKVRKDQESVKNTTVQIIYKKDIQKSKMVRKHISLINDIKEEKENKKKRAYKESSKNNSDIDDLFFLSVINVDLNSTI